MASSSSVLFVDAYDSFSQNINALLNQETGAHVTLIKIDTNLENSFGTTLENFVAGFDAIVLGPGPGNPNKPSDVGLLYGLIDAAAICGRPILGICLGFQALCVRYGLQIKAMPEPCHGQSKKISYFVADNLSIDDRDIFRGVDIDCIWATCYNSLGLHLRDVASSSNPSRPGSSHSNSSFGSDSSQSVSDQSMVMRVLATDHEDNVMAIRHRYLPFWGMQFHPESCKSSQSSRQLVKNWWTCAQQHIAETAAVGKSKAFPELSPTKFQHNPSSSSKPDNNDHIDCASLAATVVHARLQDAAATTSNYVTWRKVGTTASLPQVSQLVREITTSDDVVMLESTKKGRFSIYAVLDFDVSKRTCFGRLEASATWRATYQGSIFNIVKHSSQSACSTVAKREDVWNGLQLFMSGKRAKGGPSEIPFWGGFIGYLSYEHGLDSLGARFSKPDTRIVPDIGLIWVERSIIYDNLTSSIYVQSIRKHDREFVDAIAHVFSVQNISRPCGYPRPTPKKSRLQKLLSMSTIQLPNRDHYTTLFHECQTELRAGNSYELCLTTEATISIPQLAKYNDYEFELYRNLHTYNPVPYGAFMKLGNVAILGTSPEHYMSWSRTGVIDMRPMKGTVKRSSDMTIQKAMSILSSAKESAENLMIADLIRHDLYNTVGHQSKVEVVKLCEVVEHETVYQLVSHIRAHAPISNNCDSDERQRSAMYYGMEALRQTVPPGSMTGAPKKRSCEILSNLEQRDRGVYSGVLGYMDVGGGGDWNVCIRTAYRCDSKDTHEQDNTAKEDVWHIGAGGAITVLSDAEGEWQEMMTKLNSVLRGFRTTSSEEIV